MPAYAAFAAGALIFRAAAYAAFACYATPASYCFRHAAIFSAATSCHTCFRYYAVADAAARHVCRRAIAMLPLRFAAADIAIRRRVFFRCHA